MLPRLIHFIWIGSAPMPDWAERNLAEFRRLNPDHQILIHGEEILLPEFAPIFGRISDLCSRADLLAVSALAREGGWYIDTDVWPFRPLADAERAWRLDGARMYVSRQRGHKGKTEPLANSPLACSPDSPALRLVHDEILKTEPVGRNVYGPMLFSRLVARHPDLFCVSDPEWWFPFGIQDAPRVYEHILDGGDPGLVAAQCGGQLPYSMHLWAGGNLSLAAGKSRGPLAVVAVGETDPRKHPVGGALIESLGRLGYAVEAGGNGLTAENWMHHYSGIPQVLVVWNGRQAPKAGAVEAMRAAGVVVLSCEHGFLADRHVYTQVDHEGFLHRAPWRRAILAGDPPPAGAAERLARFLPGGIQPQRARRDGYVLVLGQVTGDSQLADSEIQGMPGLEKAVLRALPAGVPAYFRPHPLSNHIRPHRLHKLLPRLPEENERNDYVKTKRGSGLAKALAGARFIVTINSNAITEALAAGVPCLAFGPSLGIDAGTVHPTTLGTLRKDLEEMLGGWRAPDSSVRRYLEWLAARQWNPEELADPRLLARLLTDAGAKIPAVGKETAA